MKTAGVLVEAHQIVLVGVMCPETGGCLCALFKWACSNGACLVLGLSTILPRPLAGAPRYTANCSVNSKVNDIVIVLFGNRVCRTTHLLY